MQPKHITALALLAVLAVVGAFFASRGDSDSPSAAERGPFLPTLADRVNDVTSISIAKGEDTVELAREDGTWGVATRGGYPARFQSVKELLLALSELEIEQRKTAKPENYAKLGVEDQGPDAASTRVVVKAGGETLADVLFGTSRAAGREQGVNVRRTDEAQSWHVRGPRVNTAAAPKDWMEREVMKIDGQRVESATIRHADGEVVELRRAARDSNTFKVQNVPPDRTEKYEGVGNAVATALSFFSLEDVRPVGEVDFDAEPRAVTTIRCYDGLVVDVETAKVGDETWARLRCSFEAPPEPEAPADDEAEPASTPEVQPLTAEQVAAEHERVSGWAYSLASFKADALARRMEELLAEVPDEEPATPTDAAITPNLEDLIREGVLPEPTGTPADDGAGQDG